MKSGVPWSIRGIDDEIREAARRAARRSGLSVSEWLNDLIARQAAQDRVVTTPPGDDDDDDDVDGDAEANAVADAVERLTRRIRAMDENSRAALSGLQDRLDEIEGQLGAVATAGRHGGERARSLKGVASIVDQLSREIDNSDETARTMIEGLRDRATGRVMAREPAAVDRVASAIRNLDARIASMAADAKAPVADDPSTKLDTIKARLDALLAGGAEPPTNRAAALDATLKSLEAHIDQAKSRLAAVAAHPAPASTRATEDFFQRETPSRATPRRPLRGAVNDFASAVAQISARQRSIDGRADRRGIRHEEPHRDAFADLAGRIDALAAGLPADREHLQTMRGDLDALRATIDAAGLDRLAERIGQLAERAPDRDRLDTLGEEIALVRRALDAADSPRAIARLEMRVAELARSIEAALNSANAASRRGDVDAVARLESRLDDIAGRIDGFLGRAAPVDALAGLQDRFAEIIERLDGMDSGRRDPTAALDEIKAEIAAIRRDISDQAPPKVDHLENQIAELARRLDSATGSDSEGQSLAELEAQVAHLASEVERSMPRTATLKQVEENLAHLQRYLSENRDDSVEAARRAAKEAVREMTGTSGDSDLVRALKDDLENIRSAAGDTDQRTRETLGSVHETLARVVDRLTRLERDTNETGAALLREPAKATGTYGAETPARAEAAPVVRSGSPGSPEDNRPLEPGSGKPDLAALRELARSASTADRDKKGDRKADFIAAARRAAQAAAAEAATEMEEEESQVDDRPGTFARIGQAIRSRRRPLLLAAAAVVLAISAIQLFGERGARTHTAAPDTAATVSPAEPLPPVATASPGYTAPAPAMPRVGNSAMVPPPADARSAIAFAAPEAFDSRFGDGPAGPPAATFAPPGTAAPDVPSTTLAMLDAPAPAAVSLAAQPGIGPSKLRTAAASGDPTAAFEVAARYADGADGRPDMASAAQWYARAAEAGIAVAQYRLGSLYERGQGVKKDLPTAVTWYQHAADQGNVGAMHNLAVMMSQGVDGAPDHGKAFEWFQAAAKYGVKDSQYNLGVLYARGLGPAQDFVESYKWFAVAAAAGDTDAGTRRDEVAKVLSPDELAKARAAVSAWRATPVIPEANTVATPPGGWDDAADGVTEADRRSLVKKIQTLLADQGYDPGPADGFEGPKTQEAVRAFQRTVGLSETGRISADLVAALASPST